MSLTKDEILHIAKLARLALSDEEIAKFQNQLSSILEFVSQLQKVNVEGVEPTAQVTGLTDIFRADVQAACPKEVVEKLRQAFPDSVDGPNGGVFLKVPPVFE